VITMRRLVECYPQNWETWSLSASPCFNGQQCAPNHSMESLAEGWVLQLGLSQLHLKISLLNSN
jgi:hypothetical protein